MTSVRSALRLLATIVPLLGIAAGCAPKSGARTSPPPPGRTLVEASAPEQPGWVVREPATDQTYHYFRGIRSDAPSLEGGETDARHNAMSHIVEFLGLRVTVEYERMRTEEQTQIRDAIKSVGGADIFGARMSEMYYRRWRVTENGGTSDRYDVYVLIRFPLESVERIRQAQRDRLATIERNLSGPGIGAEPGELYGEMAKAGEAIRALDEFSRSLLVSVESQARIDALRQDANVKVGRLVGALQLAVATSGSEVGLGTQRTPFTITATATADRRGVATPAPNVPVKIVFGDSSRVVWTDTQGKAVWSLPVITPPVGNRTISAAVELPAALGGRPELVDATPRAEANVKVASTTATLLVVVDEQINEQSNGGRLAQGRLIAALRAKDFHVISVPTDGSVVGDPWTSDAVATALAGRLGATFLVRGRFNADTPTALAMMNGIFFTRLKVDLTVVDVADGHTIGSVVLPDNAYVDNRGFGNSTANAYDDAIKLSRSPDRQPNGYTHIADLLVRAISGGPQSAR